MKTEGWMKTIIMPVFFSIACYIGFMLSNPLYISTDNIGVAVVTNGIYGKNVFCQYLHPLLCLVIRLLHSLIPSSDAFTLLVHFVIALQIGTLFYLFAGDVFKKSIREWKLSGYVKVSMTIMSILLFTAGICIWNSNYTITTGAIMLFGLLILFRALQEQKPKRWIVAGTIYVTFGFMLRVESALLFIPFILLELLALIFDSEIQHISGFSFSNIFSKKQSRLRELIIRDQSKSPWQKLYCLIPCFLIVCLLIVSRVVFNAFEPYKTAAEYNSARTAVVDFPLKYWGPEVAEVGEGKFSEADYEAAVNWCFFDTDYFDTDKLEEIAQAGGKNQHELSIKGITGTLSEMEHDLFHTSLYMVMLIILSLVLVIRNLLCCTSLRKAETLLAFLGVFVIIAYFTFRGRAPMRVWEPVIFAGDFVFICTAFDKTASDSSRAVKFKTVVNRITVGILFIVLWFNTGQLLAYAQYHQPQSVLQSCSEDEKNPYEPENICGNYSLSKREENNILLICPNWHAHIPKYTESTGKLPSRTVMEHNIPLGDWVYGQPYFEDLLKKIGVDNPAEALVERPNTFLLEGNMKIVLNYLQEHFGNDIEFQEVGEIGPIDNLQVYRVIRKEHEQ